MFLNEKLVAALGPRKVSSEEFQDVIGDLIGTKHKRKNSLEDIPQISPELSQKTGPLIIKDDDSEPELS